MLTGDVEVGNVIMIERNAAGKWTRQGDDSVLVMDEYVMALGLQEPDAPVALPVQVIYIHDFGSSIGVEVTRNLEDV